MHVTFIVKVVSFGGCVALMTGPTPYCYIVFFPGSSLHSCLLLHICAIFMPWGYKGIGFGMYHVRHYEVMCLFSAFAEFLCFIVTSKRVRARTCNIKASFSYLSYHTYKNQITFN
jgi:hypothetical protein